MIGLFVRSASHCHAYGGMSLPALPGTTLTGPRPRGRTPAKACHTSIGDTAGRSITPAPSGSMGCFRVLSYTTADDGKRIANGGDGWIMAIEFGETPRAFSILAYGNSNDPDSPHYDDQAELFALGSLKRVSFSEAEIASTLIRAYRPE